MKTLSTTIQKGKDLLESDFEAAAMFLSPNDSKVIEVSSSTLSAKRLFKGENDTGHTVPVPDRSKDAVPKPAGRSRSSSTHTHTV